jgi:P27 family predicted phage terminase small subunit
MGLRGPKPTPNVVKLWNGNPGKRPLNLSDGVNPEIEIPSPPKWLSTHAAKEWRRIGGELETLGLIAEIDKASLATYCQTWGDLCDLELAFAAQKRMVISKTEKSDTAVMAAYFQKTPTGFLRESAIHRKIVEMRSELDRYVKNFGLNPAARARVTPSNFVQPSLPGIDDAPNMSGGFARFAQGSR